MLWASQREMDRELRTLEREEQKLIADIKKAAKDGNQVCMRRIWLSYRVCVIPRVCSLLSLPCKQKVMKILAGNLVQLRSQRDRTIGMKANLTATGYRTSVRGGVCTCIPKCPHKCLWGLSLRVSIPSPRSQSPEECSCVCMAVFMCRLWRARRLWPIPWARSPRYA